MVRTMLMSALIVLTAVVAGCEKQTAVGKSGEKLSIYKPLDEHIKQGDTGEVDIRVNRDNFVGPVTVSVTELPAGIKITNATMTIPSDESKLTLKLIADPTAAIAKDAVANVKVTAQNGLTAYETFKIDIAAR